jgi:MFS family permease
MYCPIRKKGCSMSGKKTAFTVFIIAFTLGLNVMGVSPILGVLNQNFTSFPAGAVQLLQTIPYAMLMAASLFIGPLTLIINKKRLVLIGLSIIGICGTLPFFSNSYWFLLVTRILIGFGFGLTGPLNTAIISDFIKAEHRPAYMGLHVAGMGIGALAGNLLGGIIAAIHYRYFFLVYTAAFLSSVGVLLFLFETPPQRNVEHSSLKMNGKVYFVSLMSFAHTLFITAFSTNIGIFILETMDGNTAITGTVMAVNAAFALLVGFTFSFITKIFGKWTLAAAFMFGAAGFGILLWMPGTIGIFSGGALCGVSLSCFMARGTYQISTAVTQEAVPKASGIFAIIGGIGGLSSPLILGSITDLLFKNSSALSQFTVSFTGMAVLLVVLVISEIILNNREGYHGSYNN